MPGVATAITAITTAFTSSAVGSFLTGNIFGRLLTSVAVSALRAALTRNRSSGTERAPGIRTTQTQTGGINPAAFCIGSYATEGTLVCPPMSHGQSGDIPNVFLTYVVDKVAEALGVDASEVAAITTKTAERFFRLPAADIGG